MVKRVIGGLMLLLGVFQLGWIGYNFLIELQPEARGRNPIIPILFGIGLLYVGFTWVKGKPEEAGGKR
ncbi:MAG: hypothetical protein AMXMBFR7_27960 [Planctomycetota bacterium]